MRYNGALAGCRSETRSGSKAGACPEGSRRHVIQNELIQNIAPKVAAPACAARKLPPATGIA